MAIFKGKGLSVFEKCTIKIMSVCEEKSILPDPTHGYILSTHLHI